MDTKFDNKTLDSLGEKLIRASRRERVDIDAIIGNEKFFEGVLKRINDDAQKTRRFSVFTSQRLAVVGSLATLLFVGAVAFNIYRPMTRGSAAVFGKVPVAEPETKPGPVGPPPVANESNYSAGLGKHDEAVYSDIERPAARPRAIKASAREVSDETDEDFYPVSYSGDPSEMGGGRVIRVDLPRSTLFAMGVNIPLENDSPTVKADLLVGPDGVTRAVRVVN